jgi:hypothetical protein
VTALDRWGTTVLTLNTRATVGYAVIGLVVLAWAVFFVVRAFRRRVRVGAPPAHMEVVRAPTFSSVPVGLAESSQSRDVGWHFGPNDMSEQLCWDGKSWTARRHWNGQAWIDV